MSKIGTSLLIGALQALNYSEKEMANKKRHITKQHIDFKTIIANHEFDLIEKAMNMAFENQSLAARILGISRSTLIKKLKELRMRNG